MNNSYEKGDISTKDRIESLCNIYTKAELAANLLESAKALRDASTHFRFYGRDENYVVKGTASPSVRAKMWFEKFGNHASKMEDMTLWRDQ